MKIDPQGVCSSSELKYFHRTGRKEIPDQEYFDAYERLANAGLLEDVEQFLFTNCYGDHEGSEKYRDILAYVTAQEGELVALKELKAFSKVKHSGYNMTVGIDTDTKGGPVYFLFLERNWTKRQYLSPDTLVLLEQG